MRIEIEFDTDSGTEASQLVHEVARLIGIGNKEGRFRTDNDESIGTWAITEE